MDFETLTALDRPKLLNLLPPLSRKAVHYYDGQQLGSAPYLVDYWSGPLLPVAHPKYGEMVSALKRGFAYRNATAEVCQRMADSVTASELDWSFTVARPLDEGQQPTAEEQALINEAEAALTTWWDRIGLAQHIQDRIPRLVGFARTVGRPLVPPKYVIDGQIDQVTTPEEALMRLRVRAADEPTSGIVEDPDTLNELAFSSYRVLRSSGEQVEELELSYLDDAGNTVLKIVQADQRQAHESIMPLGGRLWLFQATLARPLITDDLLSQQDALNVALTLLNKNTHFAGFVERYGVGLDPPVDADGNPRLNTGPETANFFQASIVSETETQPDGTTIVRERPMPGATWGRFEPVDPKALTAAVDYAEANLYAIARQRFMLMTDTATASGRSREVAAGDYLVAAGRVARATEGYTRQVLEFGLAFAGVLMGQPGRYDALRASVSCQVRGFAPDAADRAQDLAERNAGVMSDENLISRRGDADTDAELARLAAQREQQPAPVPVVP